MVDVLIDMIYIFNKMLVKKLFKTLKHCINGVVKIANTLQKYVDTRLKQCRLIIGYYGFD